MPKTKKPAKKEVKKEIPRNFKLDYDNDIDNQFLDYWTGKQSENVHGIYLDPQIQHGVKKIVYTRLPNFDRVCAVKNHTKQYGLPLNKIIEVFGAPDCGKTTYLKYLACLFVSIGGIATFIDFEHKFSTPWFQTIARNMGLSKEDLKRFLLNDSPKHFEWFITWLIKKIKDISSMKENAREELKKLIASKKKSKEVEALKAKYNRVISTPFVILVDSVADMYTKAEVEHEEEDKDYVAELARQFSLKLKLVRKYLGSSDTLLVFANQERDKISMGGFARPGSKSTPGGHAWKHNCDGRIMFAREGTLKRTRDGNTFVYGTKQVVKLVKNQLGIPPFRKAQIKMLYDRGYFTFYSILEACVDVGIIKKIGSKYRIKKDMEFEESAADEFVDKNPKIEEVLHTVYQKHMEKQSENE